MQLSTILVDLQPPQGGVHSTHYHYAAQVNAAVYVAGWHEPIGAPRE